MEGNIAAGLAMKLIISFETNQIGDFHDYLEIVSGNDFRHTVALHAYQPQANIVFEPFINFGFVRIHQEKVERIAFKNDGKLKKIYLYNTITAKENN